jgi:hypothetical protein
LAKLPFLEFPNHGSLLINKAALSVGFAIFDESCIHRSIFVSDCHLLALVDVTLGEPANEFLSCHSQNSTAFGPAVLPFSIIVELSLVFARAVPETLLEFSHVNVLSCDQLPLSIIEVVVEVANVFMNCVCQFAITLSTPSVEFSLVLLIAIEEVAAPAEPPAFHLSHEHVSGSQRLSLRKSDFLSLECLRIASPKTQSVLCPVVKRKLLLPQRVAVVVVLNEQRGVSGASHQLRDFLVMKLQEIGERASE